MQLIERELQCRWLLNFMKIAVFIIVARQTFTVIPTSIAIVSINPLSLWLFLKHSKLNDLSSLQINKFPSKFYSPIINSPSTRSNNIQRGILVCICPSHCQHDPLTHRLFPSVLSSLFLCCGEGEKKPPISIYVFSMREHIEIGLSFQMEEIEG